MQAQFESLILTDRTNTALLKQLQTQNLYCGLFKLSRRNSQRKDRVNLFLLFIIKVSKTQYNKVLFTKTKKFNLILI